MTMVKEELRELLDDIRPRSQEQIKRRIKNGSFAKVIVWCCINSGENDYLCTRDLAKFMRVSLQRARYILEDLVKFELLKRNKLSGCNVDYYFTYDEYGKPKVFEYFEESRKALGIQLRSLKEEETKDLNTRLA